MDIKYIKRLQNGWLVQGYEEKQGYEQEGDYVELFMDNDALVKMIVDCYGREARL